MACLAIAVPIFIYFNSAGNAPTQPFEVKDFSLSPETVRVQESATLSFALKNNDKNQSQSLRISFNVSQRIIILQGNEELLKEDGTYYLTKTLDSSGTLTIPLTVQGLLEEQVSSATYPLIVNFFFNGTQFESKKTSLTVRS